MNSFLLFYNDFFRSLLCEYQINLHCIQLSNHVRYCVSIKVFYSECVLQIELSIGAVEHLRGSYRSRSQPPCLTRYENTILQKRPSFSLFSQRLLQVLFRPGIQLICGSVCREAFAALYYGFSDLCSTCRCFFADITASGGCKQND